MSLYNLNTLTFEIIVKVEEDPIADIVYIPNTNLIGIAVRDNRDNMQVSNFVCKTCPNAGINCECNTMW